MITNIHQSIDDLLKAATPELKIVWQQIRLITGENASVRQLYYVGNCIGSEFLIYDAHILYLALSLELTNTNTSNTIAQAIFYNENNASMFQMVSMYPYWDTTAALVKSGSNNIETKNLYFSRFTRVIFTEMKFIGFKFTY